VRALVDRNTILTDRQFEVALILQERPTISGPILARQFGITRQAIWHTLYALIRLGVLRLEHGAWHVKLPDLEKKPIMLSGFCRKGHRYDPDWRTTNRGDRVCRECERLREKRYKAASLPSAP